MKTFTSHCPDEIYCQIKQDLTENLKSAVENMGWGYSNTTSRKKKVMDEKQDSIW